jgi:hypothetical protein
LAIKIPGCEFNIVASRVVPDLGGPMMRMGFPFKAEIIYAGSIPSNYAGRRK